MSVSIDFEMKLDGFPLGISVTSNVRRIGILGASGSGKSMTLKAIAGIVTPDEGRIVVEGRVLFDSKKRVNVRTKDRNVGYLFQNYALFPTMTVRQNIETGLKYRKRTEAEPNGKQPAGGVLADTANRRHDSRPYMDVEEIAARFHLTDILGRLPGEISGGQQQRVALARIMANAPDVILLDEPFSALDVWLKDRMQRELFRELEAFPGTVIMVSHDRDEIYRFSEEVLIVDRGRIIAGGKTKEVFAHPETAEAARLTGCKNISAATRVDDHTVRCDDWGVTLCLKQRVPENVKHVGFRAHEFQPVWGAREENCIALHADSLTDLPFEKHCYVLPERDTYGPEQILTWMIQRDRWPELEQKGMPDYLRFAEAHVLLLS